MPRSVDYPRASLARCLELAAAVHELGDECSLEAAAERLGARRGGAFHAVVSAAGRYGLVSVRRHRLRTAPAFRQYRLAYDAAERERTLADALAGVPLFRRLLERFGGTSVPEGRLDLVLAREYGVPEHSAERVAGYFMEGMRAAGLLSGVELRERHANAAGGDDTARAGTRAGRTHVHPASANSTAGASSGANASTTSDPGAFHVRVSGPGLDSRVEVADAADLDLVRALIAKLERALRERQ